MKNLLIYINPHKNFVGQGQGKFRDCSELVKIQIDNSLDLGWKKEDILLFTNFAFKYNGVGSIVLDGSSFCPFRPLSTKTTTVSYLLEKAILTDDDIYWVHDFDAYQLNPFSEEDLSLDPADIGFTDYGWSSKWSLGSYFFKRGAKDILKKITDTIYDLETEDERALVAIQKENKFPFGKRVKKLNITYNLGMRQVPSNYARAIKPLKIIHFHPFYNVKDNLPDTPLNCFMYGKNELKMPIMNERLIKIFNKHGIK